MKLSASTQITSRDFDRRALHFASATLLIAAAALALWHTVNTSLTIQEFGFAFAMTLPVAITTLVIGLVAKDSSSISKTL